MSFNTHTLFSEDYLIAELNLMSITSQSKKYQPKLVGMILAPAVAVKNIRNAVDRIPKDCINTVVSD